jgi:uncharacterized protein (TIGR02647 family)
MTFSHEELEELNLLLRFNLDSIQLGIKIHSSATCEEIAAIQRLYDKGMVTAPDGGYLTDLGHTSAGHAQSLFRLVSIPPDL